MAHKATDKWKRRLEEEVTSPVGRDTGPQMVSPVIQLSKTLPQLNQARFLSLQHTSTAPYLQLWSWKVKTKFKQTHLTVKTWYGLTIIRVVYSTLCDHSHLFPPGEKVMWLWGGVSDRTGNITTWCTHSIIILKSGCFWTLKHIQLSPFFLRDCEPELLSPTF